MKYYDVSTEDAMVLDSEGTIWVWILQSQTWDYVGDSNELTGWDDRSYLPEGVDYFKLDDAAQAVIGKGLK